MAIESSSRYGRQAVPLEEGSLRSLESTLREFLDDPQVQLARKHPNFLASPGFQRAHYATVPSAFRRDFYPKDRMRLGEFPDGSYGYWICLLEFLLRMTGKEIIYNVAGWNAFNGKILELSSYHEHLKFLAEGLVPSGRVISRAHLWAGEACQQEVTARIDGMVQGCRVSLVQPVVLATLKDGWGVRKSVSREMHRLAAGLAVTFDAEGTDIPAGKLRRGYAHQYGLEELVSHFGHAPDQADVMRRVTEGLDWTLRRLALFARKNVQQLLSSPSPAVQTMTVLMDATASAVRKGEVIFGLKGGDPVSFGKLREHSIGFDSSLPLPITNPIHAEELHRWLTQGKEEERSLDAVMRVVVSGHDADAHRYWEAGRFASQAAAHWQHTGQHPASGQWF